MDCAELRFSKHAFERMFQRGISPDAIRSVISTGEIIASYPEDQPYPSFLILGFLNGCPVHVVAAEGERIGICTVITAYFPDPEHWGDDFKRRR